MIDIQHKSLSIRRQCVLLGIHRSGIYYKASSGRDDTEIANELHEIWQAMPFYGYRRLTAALQRQGYAVNTKRVRRIMKPCIRSPGRR
jgi:putative transposase